MKKHLLTVSAFLLMTASAMADGWQKPEYSGAFQPLSTTDTVYIYNTESKMFLTEGNDWGTHATVSTQGLQFAVKKHLDSNGNWDGKTYTIFDNTIVKKGWKNVFITEGGNIYMDATDSAADTLFVFNDLGSNKYQITGSDKNPTWNTKGDMAGYIVGHSTLYTNTRDGEFTGTGVIYDYYGTDHSYQPGEFNSTWAFVSQADYSAYQIKISTYDTAEELDALIKEAKNFGIDASEAEAVYKNTASTKDELKAAIEALNAKILAYYEVNVTPSSPKDLTNMIANASCDAIDGWTNNINAKTWKTQNWIDSSWKGFEGNTLDIWASNLKGTVSQQFSNLPNGIYVVNIAVFSQKMDGYVYANDNTKSVAAGAAGATYTITTQVTDGTLSFGFGQETEGDNWVAIDNASLMYYGSGVEAYRFWLNGLLESAPSFDDVIVMNDLKTEYEGILASVNTASTKEAILAIIPTYEDCLNRINLNIAAYEDLSYWKEEYNLMEGLNKYYSDKIGDYIIDNINDILDEHTLDTEAVNTEANKLHDMLNEAQEYVWNKENLDSEIKKMKELANNEEIERNPSGISAYELFMDMYNSMNPDELTNKTVLALLQKVYDIEFLIQTPVEPASDTNPIDYTEKIFYNSFDNGADGWTNYGFSTIGANSWNGFADGEVIDKLYLNLWNMTTARVEQEIMGLPAGAYTVQFSAFANADNFQVYANGNSINVINGQNEGGAANIYHNTLDNYIPFVSEGGAAVNYGNIYKIDVVIKEGEILTIGGRIASDGEVWAMLDNVKLTYFGTNSKICTGINTIESETAQVVQTYSISGSRIAKAQKGINIMKMSDGSVKKVIVK